MKRRWGLAMLVLATAWMGLPAPTRAADGDILKAVPENAWATLIIRNVGEFDQKVMGVLQQLNVPPMSLLMLAKGSLGLTTGINDSGSAAVVYMPGPAAMADPQRSLAILVPTQDYAGLIGALAPQDAGDGISKVTIAMDESYVAQQGNFAVAGPAPDSVKAVLAAASGPGIAAAWTPHQLERFAQDDVTLLVNLKALFADPTLSGMLMGMFAMSGQQVTADDLQQWEALAITLRVEKDGVRLGVYVGLKEGSKAASLWAKGVTKSGTLLTGLPGERYVLALGMVQDAASGTVAAAEMKTGLQQKMQMMGPNVDQAKMTELVNTMAEMFGDLRELSFSVAAGPQGGESLVGLSKVVTFEKGAADKCAKIADMIQVIGAALPMPEVQAALQHVKYVKGAETVGGVSVDQLTIAMDQVEGVTPEDYSKLKKIVGPEGLVFRIAAIDDQHVVATLGGGAARLEKVVELVKSKAAPLGDDAGIKKTAAMLPAERYSESYLALDTLLNLVKDISTAVGEDPDIPFTVPQVDAPLGLVMAPVGKSGLQADVAVPMAVIAAAKDVAVSQGGQGGPTPGEAQEAPPAEPEPTASPE